MHFNTHAEFRIPYKFSGRCEILMEDKVCSHIMFNTRDLDQELHDAFIKDENLESNQDGALCAIALNIYTLLSSFFSYVFPFLCSQW